MAAGAIAPAALVAAPTIAEATKLASSVVGHLAAALGRPLFFIESTTTRTTKGGRTIVESSGASLPAWVAVGGALILLSMQAAGNGGGNGGSTGGCDWTCWLLGRVLWDPRCADCLKTM